MSRWLVIIFLVLGVLALVFRQGNTLTLGGVKINLEIADTPAEQTRGLSDRSDLPENLGMLFVFPNNSSPLFWMKDMNFPIDIIWLDENYVIVGFEKNVLPETYPQTFAPPQPIKYVLEVNSGFVDKQALKVGDKAYN